jgi:hypothetical protein
MALSKSNNLLWDPIRALYVEGTPEERVRQKWILAMMGPLGYPKGLISVEKDLKAASLKQISTDPNRRIDILCYTPSAEGLKPLLLVECKAPDNKESAEAQVLGYEFYVEAPFFCVIRGERAITFWKEKDRFASVPFLPTYLQLTAKL